MNFNQLEYFLAIASGKSFSDASADLFISQSSLSKQIKALEENLGIQLFNREKNTVTLTEAGIKFLAFTEKVLYEREELLDNIKSYKSSAQHTIHLGCIPIITTYGISSLIVKYQSLMQKKDIIVNFDIYEEEQLLIINWIKNNKVSLAFLRDIPQNVNDAEFIPFCDDEIVLVCSKSEEFSHQEVIELEKLQDKKFVLITQKSSLYYLAIRELKKCGIEKSSIVGTTSRHDILLDMVSNKAGCTLLPERLIDKNKYPELACLKLKEPVYSKIYIVKIKNRKINKVTAGFWEFLKAHSSQ